LIRAVFARRALGNDAQIHMETINILGVNITNLPQDEVLEKVREFLADWKPHFIVTPNPEIILEATRKDEELWYILNHADMALADGVAVKIVAWFYKKNTERITGADLTLEILKLAQSEKKNVAIFNWRDGLSTAAEIRRILEDKFPGLNFLVEDISRSGPYDFAAVNKFAPDIIFCGLGFPHQEKFIYYNLANIPKARLGLAIGGSFDFLTGKTKRAPKWMRSVGLEWLWRLIKQPKRWKRIYRAIIVFPYRFFIFFFILRWFYRRNVAGLLYKKEISTDGRTEYKILIVERVGEPGHWQLPQGGTDRENLFVAGARELREELNTANFKPVAAFKNLFKYKFSRYFDKYGARVKNQRGYKGQSQGLFIAEFTGTDSEIKINLWEHRAWRWVPSENLIETVFPARREATKIFMEKFLETVNKQ